LKRQKRVREAGLCKLEYAIDRPTAAESGNLMRALEQIEEGSGGNETN